MNTTQHRPLPSPEVEIFPGPDGKTEAAYVRLREGKAKCAVRPNADVLVWFYLGSDELPIGIKYLEPALGCAMSWVLDYVEVDGDGVPSSVGRDVEHHFFTSDQMVRLMKNLRAAEEELKLKARFLPKSGCAPTVSQ